MNHSFYSGRRFTARPSCRRIFRRIRRPDAAAMIRERFSNLFNAVVVAVTLLLPAGQTWAADSRDEFDSFTRPVQVINVAAAESGRVAAVNVQRGDVVRSGQVLMQLDARTLEAARRVAEAEAASSATIDGLKIEHELQLQRRKQLETLSEDGLSSQEELNRAIADEQISLAALRAAEELQQQKVLRVEEIEARIAARSVTSTINGIVTDVRKEPGEFVSAADPEVVTIVDLRQLRSTFFLTTGVAEQLSLQQPVHVRISGRGKSVRGIVEYIGVVTEADSGRVRVDVLLKNDKGSIRSGIRCRLLHDIRPPARSNSTSRPTARIPTSQSVQ